MASVVGRYAVRRSTGAAPEAEPLPATTAWPVSWSAVVVGGFSAITFVFLAGLIGVAIGAHRLGEGEPTRLGFWSLAYLVISAFFAFVVGGWVAGKISGDRRSETTSLHGAIAWVLSVPVLFALLALGSGPYLGTWYGGLTRLTPSHLAVQGPAEPGGRTSPTVTAPTARAQADAKATRNAALGGLTALVLGLAGGVLGGWMASGEPMSFRYRRDVADNRYTAPSPGA